MKWMAGSGQVAMEDAPLVRVVHGAGHRGHDPGRVAGGPTVAVEVIVAAPPPAQYYRKIGPAPLLAHLVDLNDIRVFEPGRRLGLGLEPQDVATARRTRRPGSP